jgi:hypothetical protein
MIATVMSTIDFLRLHRRRHHRPRRDLAAQRRDATRRASRPTRGGACGSRRCSPPRWR